jgi:hypothetical protein
MYHVDAPMRSRRPRGEFAVVRQSDRGEDPEGLPRVPPEVWVKFLANEASLNNEEGSLKLALDFLLPKTLRKETSTDCR